MSALTQKSLSALAIAMVGWLASSESKAGEFILECKVSKVDGRLPHVDRLIIDNNGVTDDLRNYTTNRRTDT